VSLLFLNIATLVLLTYFIFFNIYEVFPKLPENNLLQFIVNSTLSIFIIYIWFSNIKATTPAFLDVDIEFYKIRTYLGKWIYND
jgi:hypothetical protein